MMADRFVKECGPLHVFAATIRAAMTKLISRKLLAARVGKSTRHN
jgi:hypothetical protein